MSPDAVVTSVLDEIVDRLEVFQIDSLSDDGILRDLRCIGMKDELAQLFLVAQTSLDVLVVTYSLDLLINVSFCSRWLRAGALYREIIWILRRNADKTFVAPFKYHEAYYCVLVSLVGRVVEFSKDERIHISSPRVFAVHAIAPLLLAFCLGLRLWSDESIETTAGHSYDLELTRRGREK